MHTCLPLALSIPEQMAHAESKTWNSATKGMIDATSVTTSGSIAVCERLICTNTLFGHTDVVVK